MGTSLAVIPVRMGASRLPGKPLADLGGRPIVQWVYERAVAAGLFDEVVVATPDEEIATLVRRIGGRVEMTSDRHSTGTDRVAEVADRFQGCDVVANIQGDQPFVDADMLGALLTPYAAGERPDMVTIGVPLGEGSLEDEHTVKVLLDRRGHALYFSRSPVPHGWSPQGETAPVLHHLGLYAFRADFLHRYADLEPTPFEKAERLEQLRVLEHGHTIRVVTLERGRLLEINTADDLDAARALVTGGDER